MNIPSAHRYALLLLLASATASAEILAGGGKITLGASLTETYNSNMEGREGAQSSFQSSFSPSIAYSRNESLISSSANLGMSVERDFENSQYNQESYSGSGAFTLEKGTLGNYSVALSVNYSDGASINYDVGQRLRTQGYGIQLSTAWDTSERTTLSFDSGYSDSRSNGLSHQQGFNNTLDFRFGPFLRNANLYATYSNHITKSSGENELGAALDQTSNSLSLGAGKQLNEKLSARANVGYSWFDNANAIAGQNAGKDGSIFISSSLSGPFLPQSWVSKTTSSFTVTYSDEVSRGLRDSGGKSLSGTLGLGWQARESTSVNFSAARSRRLTVQDTTAETSSLSLSISERLPSGLNLAASVGYSWNTFIGTLDAKQNSFNTSASASQSFGKNQNWSASLIYTHRTSSSSTRFRNFGQDVATAALRYSY